MRMLTLARPRATPSLLSQAARTVGSASLFPLWRCTGICSLKSSERECYRQKGAGAKKAGVLSVLDKRCYLHPTPPSPSSPVASEDTEAGFSGGYGLTWPKPQLLRGMCF